MQPATIRALSPGYKPHHCDLSMRVGEDLRLPAVRKASPETLVIADGFSCRDQIRPGTKCWGMHPAEVLALESRDALPASVPERRYLDPPARVDKREAILAAGAAAVLGVLVASLSTLRDRRG